MTLPEKVTVELDARDLNVLKWAPTLLRGIEDADDGISGVRQGEAMSDVLAAIYRRAERAWEATHGAS